MSYLTNSCYFCAEAENLIHMDTNSLIINSVYIDFAQLIIELMQTKIDDDSNGNMICIACKDQLSQFYIMKQQASKHLKPSEIRKQQIIDTIVGFLDSTPTDCIVSKYSNLIAVHTDTNDTIFADQLQNCNTLLESPEMGQEDNEEQDYIEQDIKTEFADFSAEQSSDFEKYQIEIVPEDMVTINEDDFVLKDEDKAEAVHAAIAPRRPKKYQKSNLDPKQREWVRKELKQSAVCHVTSFGTRTQWCCKKCSFKCLTENAFRVHLKTHVENTEVEQLEEELVQPVVAAREVNPDNKSLIAQKLWLQHQLQSQKEYVETSEGIRVSWSCSECTYVTIKRGRFRLHLQKFHTTVLVRGPNKHSCFDCHLRFDGESHLNVHRNCHRIFDVIAPYAQYPTCDCCKLLFCTNDDLQVHLQRHKENPEALHDPITALGVVHRNGEAFVNDDEDPPEIPDLNAQTCGHCLLKFCSENECKHHLMLYHATSFTCPFDSRVFSGIPTLSFGNHLRQCHPDIFPDLEIACSFCKMQFETVYNKLAHMKVCKAKNFQCDHCDRSFFRKAELLHHLKVVTGLMVFACHLCGKRCKDQGDLKTHIRSHTNVRPYQCPHCEKAYKTSSARASHVESHMEQTHVCNVCNVKFRRRILYQRHMKLLHDEAYRMKCFTENTCKVCNKSYLRKTHFKNHMKTHNIS